MKYSPCGRNSLVNSACSGIAAMLPADPVGPADTGNCRLKAILPEGSPSQARSFLRSPQRAARRLPQTRPGSAYQFARRSGRRVRWFGRCARSLVGAVSEQNQGLLHVQESFKDTVQPASHVIQVAVRFPFHCCHGSVPLGMSKVLNQRGTAIMDKPVNQSNASTPLL